MLNLADAFLREGACDKRSFVVSSFAEIGLIHWVCLKVSAFLYIMDWDKFICSCTILNGVIFISTVLESTMMKMKPYEKGIYLNNRPIEMPITLYKKSADNQLIIPVAGTEFQILDADKNVITFHAYYPHPIEITNFVNR